MIVEVPIWSVHGWVVMVIDSAVEQVVETGTAAGVIVRDVVGEGETD